MGLFCMFCRRFSSNQAEEHAAVAEGWMDGDSKHLRRRLLVKSSSSVGSAEQ